MQTTFHKIETLPKFGWYLSANFKTNEAVIVHGAWVEIAKNFIVEGVWSEPFLEGNFHQSECFFGSGVVLEKETVILVPSLATTDYLYYQFVNGILNASNSLPFLLAKIGDQLDPKFTGYAAINNSIMKGIESYQRTIPTQNGSINRLLHNNLVVTSGGYKEQPKPMPQEFKSYEEYVAYLKQAIQACFANARSPERLQPYDIFSTQSKGYDTTAVNSLAAYSGDLNHSFRLTLSSHSARL